MKKLFLLIGFAGIILFLGAVGASDMDSINLGQLMGYSFFGLFLFTVGAAGCKYLDYLKIKKVRQMRRKNLVASHHVNHWHPAA